MQRRERGTVVEARPGLAVVRLAGSAACAGCAAAGGCRAAGGDGGRLLEALDPLACPVGALVEVAVDAGPERRAAVRRWLFPAAGILGGAGLAQLAADALLPPGAASNAAGIGAIAGALAGGLLARARPARRGPARPAAIVRRLDGDGATPGRVDGAPGRG